MRLIALGAWRGLRNAAGERPVDVAKRRSHIHLLRILEPPRHVDVAPEVLRRIQVYFHAVIRVRARRLVDEHALRLPELEVMLELVEPQLWLPVPDMYGGFKFRLEPAGSDSRLVSDSYADPVFVEDSEEQHEITAFGVTQRVVEVRVPDDGAGSLAFSEFALTYHGYELHGDPGLGELVLPLLQRWELSGELSEDVNVLRACLFFAQRADHWNGGLGGPFDRQPFVAALVRRIRGLSGGSVPLRRMRMPAL
jgi:hypothetical protein